MRIIIIANFPANLSGGNAKGRFLYLGEMLCKRGHQVELVISDFDHGKKHHREEGSIMHKAYKTKITALHEPGYPNNISIKRLWSHFVWGRNVNKYLKGIDKPEAIYCAIPSLTAGVCAAKFCKKQGIRFIIDVQDLWPEAFQIAIKNKLIQQLFLPFTWYANAIYSRADNVVAVSKTYVNRVLKVNKQTQNGLSVYLGNDCQLFDDSRNTKPINKDKSLELAYIGSLSYSYDIPCVIDALQIYNKLQATPLIKFIIMGDGVLRKVFEQKATNAAIDFEFTGALPYPQMVARLCQCDIVINPIVKDSPASIINKVGDYALSGLPVINTQESPEYRHLVDKYRCGINCECGNAHDVANALIKLANDSVLCKKMGENARKLGVDLFDRRNTYLKIIEIIES